MAELADALDLGSSGRPWGFKSLYPHQKILQKRIRFLRYFFIQVADLVYHHDAVVYIISPTGCISSRASVYLFCDLMIYKTSF